jgi:hypothetical protein
MLSAKQKKYKIDEPSVRNRFSLNKQNAVSPINVDEEGELENNESAESSFDEFPGIQRILKEEKEKRPINSMDFSRTIPTIFSRYSPIGGQIFMQSALGVHEEEVVQLTSRSDACVMASPPMYSLPQRPSSAQSIRSEVGYTISQRKGRFVGVVHRPDGSNIYGGKFKTEDAALSACYILQKRLTSSD